MAQRKGHEHWRKLTSVMTEQEWLKSNNPERMLAFVRPIARSRKLCLFVAACCRRLWDLLPDESSRTAVAVAERHADGLADTAELQAARAAARPPAGRWQQLWHRGEPRAAAILLARQAVCGHPKRAARRLARAAGLAAATQLQGQTRDRMVGAWGRGLASVPTELAPAVWQALSVPAWITVRAEHSRARQALAGGQAAERRYQAELLREIVGNPFRPIAVDRSCLTWQSGTVPNLAQALYEEHRFADLPILADALEEAGCSATEILSHLRGQGPHVQGCWALDLLRHEPIP
jgi:hypothetical protein